MKNELDSLLVEFGKAIEDEEYYGIADFKQRALQWISAKKGKIYYEICAEDRYPKFKNQLDKTEIDDAMIALVEIWITPLCGGLPVITLSKILLISGLNKLCCCE